MLFNSLDASYMNRLEKTENCKIQAIVSRVLEPDILYNINIQDMNNLSKLFERLRKAFDLAISYIHESSLKSRVN